jgi:hypothetical protein
MLFYVELGNRTVSDPAKGSWRGHIKVIEIWVRGMILIRDLQVPPYAS